jgi:hypothetical protein
MTDSYYLTVAETAKLVRAALKREFPGVKFSVRSSSYAGGAAIDVTWTDGPQDDAVKAVTGRYSGADFDGMIDLKTYNSHWLYEDGHSELFMYQGGHSFGSTVYGADGEPVRKEDVPDYSLGVRHGAGVTNTIEPRNRDALAFRRGLRDGRKRVEGGARLVHFGADYVMTHRDRSEAYEASLQDAVVLLSGSDGPFDGNRRYDLAVEVPGRAYCDYGHTLVYQLSRVDPEALAAAVGRETARREMAAAS